MILVLMLVQVLLLVLVVVPALVLILVLVPVLGFVLTSISGKSWKSDIHIFMIFVAAGLFAFGYCTSISTSTSTKY